MASLLARALTPDRSFNYDFLCAAYALLSLVSIAFFAMEHVWDVEGAKGYWMITAPCIPGLAYFGFLRQRARAAGVVPRDEGAARRAKKD